MEKNHLEESSKNATLGSIANFFVNFFNLILFFMLPVCFKSSNTIFQPNTFYEVAFTQLVCCMNQISFIAYFKRNEVKSPFLKKMIKTIHKMFVYLNVIITSIETYYYLYMWFCASQNLSEYAPKEALMSSKEKIFFFILIRLIPLLSSIFIFLASDERVSKTSIISALVFFPLYLKRLNAYFDHYGEYPHPFLNKLSAADMNVICILLTILTLLMLVPLDKIKKIQLKFKEEFNQESYCSPQSKILYLITNQIVACYSFIDNILSTLELSIKDLMCLEWLYRIKDFFN